MQFAVAAAATSMMMMLSLVHLSPLLVSPKRTVTVVGLSVIFCHFFPFMLENAVERITVMENKVTSKQMGSAGEQEILRKG